MHNHAVASYQHPTGAKPLTICTNTTHGFASRAQSDCKPLPHQPSHPTTTNPWSHTSQSIKLPYPAIHTAITGQVGAGVVATRPQVVPVALSSTYVVCAIPLNHQPRLTPPTYEVKDKCKTVCPVCVQGRTHGHARRAPLPEQA